MAAHPLGWQSLFGAVPTTADASRRLVDSKKMNLSEVTTRVVGLSDEDTTVLRWPKLFWGEENKRYVVTAMTVAHTPFAVVSFAPYQPPGEQCFMLVEQLYVSSSKCLH